MMQRVVLVSWMFCLVGVGLRAQEGLEVSQQPSSSGYFLVVESLPAHQKGLKRYLISLELPEGDRVSSIYGTDVHPLRVHAPDGVFNSPYNGSWSASGMNPKFFEIMPDMTDDTYASVGLTTGSKISGMEGAEDPTMVQDPGAPWDSFFTVNGETTLAIDTHTGGAWFVLRTASNGAPVQGRVLLMQVTTAGNVEGTLNAQIFPARDDVDQVRYRFDFDGTGTFPGRLIE